MLKISRPTLLLLCRSRQSCSRFSTGQNRYARFRRRDTAESEPQTGSSRINSSQPGIGGRLGIIKEDQPDIEEMNLAEEDIEDMEQDFLDSKEIAKEHEREMKARNFKIGLKITERKYFKQPVEPNLLSWSEKEQIRNLHSEDRLVWTVQKLAESFPATEDIIAKVLKATWNPSGVEKVRKHDEKVAENWRKLYSGELIIHNQNLREHLNKFNRRNSLPNTTADYSSYAVKSLPEPKTSEFSSIIQSYKRLKLQSEGEHSSQELPKIEEHLSKEVTETKTSTSNKNKRLEKRIRYALHTLDTLRMDVAKRMENDGGMKEEEKEMDRQLIKKYVEDANKRHEVRRLGGEEEESSEKNWKGIKDEEEEAMERSWKGEGGVDVRRGMREKEEGKGAKKNWKVKDGDLVENYGSYNNVVGENERMNKTDSLKENKYDRERLCGGEENGNMERISEKMTYRKKREDWTRGDAIIEFSEAYNKQIDNETEKKFGYKNLTENRTLNSSNLQTLREAEDSSGEKIIEFESADSEIYTCEKQFRSADLGNWSEKSRSSQFDANLDWGEKSSRMEGVGENWGGKGGLNSGSADLETVEIGRVGSNVYESQFDAGATSPPARYNKEGKMIWRPEKKHAVDDIAYRIRIPKEKIKKGYLYKVKDCFYTHEGEFLYRVPGMT
ncbi:hypothetical protein LSTR_LSTR007597 [Laodelphax striatellus]|uniref:Uncharacterized protein n=1 Tax=Laodelphax striatellus TaxID=195883 RepID=A0A482XMM6_LAOST|nr:hypothetical protein LSTR_LSTR007597 [Laodelphax striatellus]